MVMKMSDEEIIYQKMWNIKKKQKGKTVKHQKLIKLSIYLLCAWLALILTFKFKDVFSMSFFGAFVVLVYFELTNKEGDNKP